jgi:excisionase family DNA binding protein
MSAKFLLLDASAHEADAEREMLASLPPMLTVAEAARFLRVNVKTLYAEIQAKRLPAIRFRRVIRIPRAVVLSMLEQARVTPPGGRNGG